MCAQCAVCSVAEHVYLARPSSRRTACVERVPRGNECLVVNEKDHWDHHQAYNDEGKALYDGDGKNKDGA